MRSTESSSPASKRMGAFENHIAARLPFGPRGEIGHDDRMDQRIQVGESLRIGENLRGEVGAVQGAAGIGFGAEAGRDARPEFGFFGHQPFGRGVGVVDRDAPLREKAATYSCRCRCLRDSDLHHGFSGTSISGMSPTEMILISLNRGARAF